MFNYLKSSWNEIVKHVSWPTFEKAQQKTITVAIFTVVFSLLLWGLDFSLNEALSFILNFIS